MLKSHSKRTRNPKLYAKFVRATLALRNASKSHAKTMRTCTALWSRFVKLDSKSKAKRKVGAYAWITDRILYLTLLPSKPRRQVLRISWDKISKRFVEYSYLRLLRQLLSRINLKKRNQLSHWRNQLEQRIRTSRLLLKWKATLINQWQNHSLRSYKTYLRESLTSSMSKRKHRFLLKNFSLHRRIKDKRRKKQLKKEMLLKH